MTKQPTLTKADLIEERLCKVTQFREESETIVETIFDSIIQTIQGEKIRSACFLFTCLGKGRAGAIPKPARSRVSSYQLFEFQLSKGLKDFVDSEEAAATTTSAAADRRC